MQFNNSLIYFKLIYFYNRKKLIELERYRFQNIETYKSKL